jgi:hypothetical protein
MANAAMKTVLPCPTPPSPPTDHQRGTAAARHVPNVTGRFVGSATILSVAIVMLAAVLMPVSEAAVAKCKTCQPVAHILGLVIKILSYSPERFAAQLASPVGSCGPVTRFASGLGQSARGNWQHPESGSAVRLQ